MRVSDVFVTAYCHLSLRLRSYYSLSLCWCVLQARVRILVEERERAISLAQALYAQKKADGVDFSAGPCLSEDLMDGWVADIVHTPRQPVDDVPENQCQSYRAGRAFRLVELDPDGKIIRAE